MHQEALQQAKAFQEQQEQAMKDMKMTMWDLITKVFLSFIQRFISICRDLHSLPCQGPMPTDEI